MIRWSRPWWCRPCSAPDTRFAPAGPPTTPSRSLPAENLSTWCSPTWSCRVNATAWTSSSGVAPTGRRWPCSWRPGTPPTGSDDRYAGAAQTLCARCAAQEIQMSRQRAPQALSRGAPSRGSARAVAGAKLRGKGHDVRAIRRSRRGYIDSMPPARSQVDRPVDAWTHAQPPAAGSPESAQQRDALRALQLRVAASEARFRSLMRLSSAWYWEQDTEFRFIDTVSRTDDRGGLTPQQHLGLRRWELPRTDAVGHDLGDPQGHARGPATVPRSPAATRDRGRRLLLRRGQRHADLRRRRRVHRLSRPRPRRHRAGRGRPCDPPCEARGGRGERGQVALPRQHEPRDPHADERPARHGRPAARRAADRAAARARAVARRFRRRSAGHHQRHPRLLEDRGRPVSRSSTSHSTFATRVDQLVRTYTLLAGSKGLRLRARLLRIRCRRG